VPDEEARFARLESIAVDVARSAAALVRAAVGHAVDVGRKSSPSDVVTQTDLDAEALIRRQLADYAPGSGVIGEEGGSTSFAASEIEWIVDPLDGTVNFTYGIPIVAVSIAAAVEGRVVAGAVVDVVHGEIFRGSLGNGATHQDTPMNGSRCDRLDNAIVTTGFSYAADLRRQQGTIVAALLPAVRDVRCFGSAALQMCWVGLGRVDAYYERDTKLWDYAAAALIAAESGAAVELPCPENNGLAIASMPALFPALRAGVEEPPEPR
jgi:myo-inositol-1(or 4)-monophosphatase